MVHESTQGESCERVVNARRLPVLFMLAIATSIDALAVGLSFARLRIRIWYPSLVIGLVAAGLVVLTIGSKALVQGAVKIATALGVGELLIGLTVVAGGTSLPELATSVVAAIRGQRDIAVGNVVGSSIYNILAVLGVSALIRPVHASEAMLAMDLPFMVAVAAACLPIFYTGHRIARWEGALFLGYYAAYVIYLALDAVQHESMPTYRAAMVMWAVPLTAVTLAVLAGRAWLAGNGKALSTGNP